MEVILTTAMPLEKKLLDSAPQRFNKETSQMGIRKNATDKYVPPD